MQAGYHKKAVCLLYETAPMNKILFFLLSSLFALQVSGQERISFQGKVIGNGELLEHVHINNISTSRYVVSDVNGRFQIEARAGDTLVLSRVGMQDLIRFVEQEELESALVDIKMIPADNELSEVEISDHSEINAVSLGIIEKDIKPLTTYERRLYTAGDFKPIHLLGLLVGSLEIDPIINAISGRTKRMKRNIRVEKKTKNLVYLETNYADYLLDTMGLDAGQMQQFLTYLVEQEALQGIIDSKNEDQLLFYLHDEWLKFEK